MAKRYTPKKCFLRVKRSLGKNKVKVSYIFGGCAAGEREWSLDANPLTVRYTDFLFKLAGAVVAVGMKLPRAIRPILRFVSFLFKLFAKLAVAALVFHLVLGIAPILDAIFGLGLTAEEELLFCEMLYVCVVPGLWQAMRASP